MIAVDTNVLVYAHRAEVPAHGRAASALERLAEGEEPWCIPWPCVHEFLRVVTDPQVYKPCTPVAGAIDQIEAWMESPTLSFLSEAEGYWPLFRSVLTASGVTGPRVHDARIAALCQLHGVRELWSSDRDFSRFPGLVVRNPLVP